MLKIKDFLDQLKPMKILWKGFKKILRQILGKENIFGYKSTTANQLYLLYCLNGKIYFIDTIHQVKYLWLVPLSFEISVCYFAAFTNLWYESEKDFMMVFDVMNLLEVCNMAVFVFPLISYWFRDGIEAMIAQVDDIIELRSSSREKYKNTISLKKVLVFNLSIFCTSFMATFLYLLDALIFFEMRKTESRYYYPLSVPLSKRFRSQGNFFIFNFLLSLAIVQIFGRCFATLFFMLYWSVTCHNEIIHTANEIYSFSNDLNAYIGQRGNPSVMWDQHFIEVLTQTIKRFQKITSAIDNFRGFFQMICAITIPTSFLVIVAQLHVTLTKNLPFILKLKPVAYCLGTGWAISLSYWAAQMLEVAIFELSLAVYSTPWYRSTEPRKIVQTFLCQTQRTKSLKISKVHSLLLQNFSRYLHGILSVTNAIRKLTEK